MKKADVFEFYRRLAESNPAPETELEYVNPYTLLVAVALSAQATDVGVNKATRSLFAKVTTPQQMLDLGEDGLKQHIKTIGLFNTKAKNVIAAAQILVDEFGGEVPKERERLETLPGVGRKTANVVLNVAYRPADHSRRHSYFSRRQPHRPCARQEPARGRAKADQNNAWSIRHPRAPLADPAWPLYLQGTPARMLAMPGRGLVRLQAQNPRAQS